MKEFFKGVKAVSGFSRLKLLKLLEMNFVAAVGDTPEMIF